VASNDDKRQRQQRAEAMRKERESAARRRRNGITVAIVVVVLALIVAAGFSIKYYTDQNNAPAAVPTGLTDDNGVVFDQETSTGESAAGADPISVVLYEDFQCPACKALFDVQSAYIKEQVDNGTISVEYRPIAILDRASDGYSTRASAASVCVAEDAGAKAFYEFHNLLYANQPPEGGTGLPEDQVVSYAEEVGADAAAACIEDGTYEKWAEEATSAASVDGISGTPTVLVDGKLVENPTAELETAVAAAG